MTIAALECYLDIANRYNDVTLHRHLGNIYTQSVDTTYHVSCISSVNDTVADVVRILLLII